MTSSAQSWEQDEAQFIESLRARYEAAGFSFTAHPERKQIPKFLGTYLPDALAQKQGHNLVIEVKRRRSSSTENTLRKIRRLFEGQSDWQLHVVYMGSDPTQSVTLRPPSPAAVRNRMKEVRNLVAQGDRRSAFVMSWALLEAAFRALSIETASSPRTPGTVVQSLATNGYIEPELERRLRDLIYTRNRIVHGDLDLEPATEDVELVLSGVEKALNQNRT
jgi:uncharacterized protein YutE (UPF0331/DUF86 family)